MEKSTDVLVFPSAICTGASQIALTADEPSRKRSGIED